MVPLLIALAAAPMDVASFHRLCVASAPSCRLFVAGVMEGAHLAARRTGDQTHFCAAADDEAADVAASLPAIVAQDMRDHPDDGRLAAVAMVAAVAEQLHPCR